MSTTTRVELGGIVIERLLEMEMPFLTPDEAYIGPTPELIQKHRGWMEPWALCPASGKLILAVQSYLVHTKHHRILIDTCVGCGKTNSFFEAWHKRSDAAWLSRLRAAGVSPEEIDFVFCTHLHSDHCGWNTRLLDGRWVPTFPNARYIMAKPEVEHYAAQPNEAYHESVLPVMEAGLADLVEIDYALDDEVWLEPLPGHTPGHVAVRLSSHGKEAVMCGDVMHSPIQCAHPDWRYRIDHDPDRAIQSRRSFLEGASSTGRLVLTAHFPSPSMGRIVGDGKAYRFDFL